MRQRDDKQEFSPSPETEYLTLDLQELVNDSYETLMASASTDVIAYAYRPNGGMPDIQLPDGIDNLRTIHRLSTGEKVHDFHGMDIAFSLNSEQRITNLSVLTNWSESRQTGIVLTSIGPVLLCGTKNESALHSRTLEDDSAAVLLSQLGLPSGMSDSVQADFPTIIRELSLASRFEVKRTVEDVIDPATTIRFIHSSLTGNDITGERDMIQELAVETTHFENTDIGAGSNLRPTYRHIMRFERDETQGEWRFTGHYEGSTIGGDFPSDIELEEDTRISVPPSKLLEKTLRYLGTIR